eukprot:1325756-Prymnesium_polylepis.1
MNEGDACRVERMPDAHADARSWASTRNTNVVLGSRERRLARTCNDRVRARVGSTTRATSCATQREPTRHGGAVMPLARRIAAVTNWVTG